MISCGRGCDGLSSPENNRVHYDPTCNCDQEPRCRSSPPLAVFVLCYPAGQASEQKIYQQQHRQNQRWCKANIIKRVVGRREKHRGRNRPQTHTSKGGGQQDGGKAQERMNKAIGPRLLRMKKTKHPSKYTARHVTGCCKQNQPDQPIGGRKRFAAVNVAEDRPPRRDYERGN